MIKHGQWLVNTILRQFYPENKCYRLVSSNDEWLFNNDYGRKLKGGMCMISTEDLDSAGGCLLSLLKLRGMPVEGRTDLKLAKGYTYKAEFCSRRAVNIYSWSEI